MGGFDWHGGSITRETPVTSGYRNTQNVRRFLRQQCGADFVFDRGFMQWIKDGKAKTMGDVADEWLGRRGRLLQRLAWETRALFSRQRLPAEDTAAAKQMRLIELAGDDLLQARSRDITIEFARLAQLKKEAAGNTPTRVLGLHLGRTPEAVQSKASEIGLSLKPTNQSPYGTKK